jgi:flavin-dependent dehydrogenase
LTNPWDVLVVGRGPAAFAAAIAARRAAFSVAVVGVADVAPRWGETLPAPCLPLLLRLGVADQLRNGEHVPEHGLRSVWGRGEAQERAGLFNAYGASVILDRGRFVQRLEDAFQGEGGYLIEGRAGEIRRTDGSYAVSLAGHPNGRCLSARALVDATGIKAQVSRRFGARRAIWARQVAFGACYTAPPGGFVPRTAFVEAVEQGWLYAAPLAADRAVVWFVSDADLLFRGGSGGWESMTRQVRGSLEIARWLREWRLRETGERCVRNASVSGLDRAGGDGWVAVGDAALSLDPLSSSGVMLALLSGLHGGTAVATWLSGNSDAMASYIHMLVEAAKHHLEQRGRFHRAEGRWPEAAFWRRRRGLVSVKTHDESARSALL